MLKLNLSGTYKMTSFAQVGSDYQFTLVGTIIDPATNLACQGAPPGAITSVNTYTTYVGSTSINEPGLLTTTSTPVSTKTLTCP